MMGATVVWLRNSVLADKISTTGSGLIQEADVWVLTRGEAFKITEETKKNGSIVLQSRFLGPTMEACHALVFGSEEPG